VNRERTTDRQTDRQTDRHNHVILYTVRKWSIEINLGS